MRGALLQMTSSDDPGQNQDLVVDMIERAVQDGAQICLTPEVTNCVSTSRSRQEDVLQREEHDTSLAAFRAAAQHAGIWLLIGSLALKTDDRFINRSYLIAPDGGVVAHYDKIHMFDVQVSETETYRESAGYRPGETAVIADTDFGQIGLCICYDVRFPSLFAALARAGASIITVPSAFSPVTGDAHWETLLRARAIETGAWILAPAQTGTHAALHGKARKTHGHSMVIDPWGTVVLDAGTEPGIYRFDIDPAQAARARAKIPALDHIRPFATPQL